MNKEYFEQMANAAFTYTHCDGRDVTALSVNVYDDTYAVVTFESAFMHYECWVNRFTKEVEGVDFAPSEPVITFERTAPKFSLREAS